MADAKTVLITGTSTGFGRAMVDEFLGRGWHVVASLRRAEVRRDLLAPAEKAHPGRVTVLDLDVTDPASRARAVEAMKAHGRLDCLVNNAGYGTFGALEDLSDEQLRRQHETNFLGPVLLTRDCLPLIRAAKGSVVFISSIFGINGFPLTGAYCSSKFAMEGMAESLYYELEPHGVRVALLEPGASVTGFGASVVWGERDTEAYRSQTKAYHRLKKKIADRKPDLAAGVAKKAADFACGRSKRLRQRVGGDAHVGYAFRRLTPSFLSTTFSRIAYGRLFRGDS